MSNFRNVEDFLQNKNILCRVESNGRELRIICPYCKNPKQKCYVHSGNGCFNCFHCGAHGAWKALSEKLGEPDATIPAYELKEDDEPDLPPIDPSIVEELHQRLLSDTCKPIRDYLYKKRGYTDDTIKKFKLGWDGKCIIIPVFDTNGDCVNFRKRPDPTHPNAKKILFSISGRGRKRLFNEQVLKKSLESVVVSEGEWDCMSLNQNGYFSVTSTAGALSFDTVWIDAFENIERIFICFDNDRNGVGQQAAIKTAQQFYEKGKSVYIVNLPKPIGIEQKTDVNSFFVDKRGKASDAFSSLLKKAQKYEPKDQPIENQHTREKLPLLEKKLDYSEIENKVLQLLPGAETPLKIVLAVAISSCFNLPAMVWLLLVDVPSSGKTDLVRLVREAEITFYLDNLTQNAFISGERETKSQKVHDLLPLLDKKCFVVKDWTSIFSLDEKMTKKLLGDLVNIYDKEFAKFSSRRGNVTYESSFSHLGCVTPATLNRHSTYMNMVGARFLCYTLPETTPENEAISRKAIFAENNDREAIEQEARKYVSSYLQQLATKALNIKVISQDAEEYLWIAANLVANCRGIIILQSASFKNEKNEEIKYYDVLDVQIERPWRALHQLIALARCLSFVVGKDEVGIEELEIIKEVVMASMPADRSKALRAMQIYDGQITAKELSNYSETSQKTSRRILDELAGLKVLQKIKGTGSMATGYKIDNKFKDFICNSTREFLSSHSSKTENRYGLPKKETTDSLKEKKEYSFPVEEENTVSPWEQYVLRQPVASYSNERLLSELKFNRDYSIGEFIPVHFKKIFLAQVKLIEEECIKRSLLVAQSSFFEENIDK